MHVGEGEKFPVHPFIHVIGVEAYGFSGKNDLLGHTRSLRMEFLGIDRDTEKKEGEYGSKLFNERSGGLVHGIS